MKTIKLIALFAVLLFSTNAFAQVSIGLSAGYNKAWEKYDVELPEDAQTHIHGFTVSALAYFQLGKHFEIGLEPGYTKRGAACEPGFIIFNRDTKLYLDYINLPLLVSYQLPIIKHKLSIGVEGGYSVSYLASAQREIMDLNTGDMISKTKLELDNEFSNMNRLDHGLNYGLKIEYQVGIGKILLNARQYHGLMDVDQNNASKNRGFGIGLGYRVNL